MKCVKCGTLHEFTGRLQFRARCRNCDSPLHVCIQCRFYDSAAYNECRESKAERVVDKKRENRCEYFAPGSGDGNAGTDSGNAKKKFDDLFS